MSVRVRVKNGDFVWPSKVLNLRSDPWCTIVEPSPSLPEVCSQRSIVRMNREEKSVPNREYQNIIVMKCILLLLRLMKI